MSWDKSTVIQFFNVHEGKTVQILEASNRVKFRGLLSDFYEMDLCSTHLVEVTLTPQTPGLQIALTCHDDFLGIHILTTAPSPEDPDVSLPYHVNYSQLDLQAVPDKAN